MNVDLLVIGMGPAGLQAAIHAARKKVTTLVVGKESGSALYGAHIENYFGVSGPMDGEKMLKVGMDQARSSGASIIRANAVSAEVHDGRFSITLESGEVVDAESVILATGISRKKLGVPGEKELFGKGVSYCAVCDCNFYKGVPVMVIGDESEAAISAEFMTKYASEVYWSLKNPDVNESLMSRVATAGVKVLNVRPLSIEGTDKVTSVIMEDGSTIQVNGVFIELGARSSIDLAMDMGVMPEVDDTLKVSYNCMTSVPGVFACGDVTGKPWQVAKAVGQGAVAGLSVADYLKRSK